MRVCVSFWCELQRNRAITNDDTSTEIDGGPITSAKIVSNIRKTMNDTVIVNVPIQAYIIPSVDAHQVKFKVPFLNLIGESEGSETGTEENHL